VRARILGSAAGGGFPQWNCRCPTCEATRAGTAARPRTQSSLAIRGEDGPWFLANASPDVRQQLEALAPDGATGIRAAPVAGVLLTDAEIDHTAGLLLLRESTTAIRVYGSAPVRRALTEGFPVLRILGRYCGVEWRTLEPGRPLAIDGSSLEVEPLGAGGVALTYVPGLARLDGDVLDRLAASDVVLVDGTFWRDDELARLGISDRTASQMGHVALSGPDGTIAALAALERPRVILVHINNTNPVLLEHSAERDAVRQAGLEVGHDGLEVEL
jgi:pyrroloquinoline quinone biosynthesis protein B